MWNLKLYRVASSSWSRQYRVVCEESAGGPGPLDLHHAEGLGQPPLQLLPARRADHLAEDLQTLYIMLFPLSSMY